MNHRESDSERMPPANIEAEMCVLGSILMDNSTLDEVTAILRPEDFYRDDHALLYRRICETYDRADPIDAITLAEDLERRGEFARVGGDDYLAKLLGAPPHAGNARYYARIVQQKATSRMLVEIANGMLADAYSNSFDADELLAKADDGIATLAASRMKDDVKTAADAATASLLAFRGRIDGVKAGIPTGLALLDDYIGGLRPGRLIVLAARPSLGKSSLVTTILANVAAAGFPVLLFSMEMADEEIGDRLICGHSGVDGHSYTNPYTMRDREHRAVATSGEWVSRLPLLIDDDSSKSIRQIVARSRRAVMRDGVKVIAIDYLQLLDQDDSRSRASRSEFVAKCSRDLKKMADQLKVPVILVSQLNREAEKRDRKRPALADLRESGAIEQDANVVGLIHRPDFYDPNDMPGVTELIIAKNRGGRTGVVKLGFRQGQTRFVDYEEPARYAGNDADAEPFG